jgi:TRAP transporter TAXI family solute receptor
MLKNLSRQFLVRLCAAIFGYTAFAADKNSYILATASTGGTFYPVGVAISTLAKVKLEPSKYYGKMTLSAITSGGSGANIKLLRDNEAQFAILQGLYGRWAATGTGKLKSVGKQSHLRSVSMLWQNVEHMVIDSEYVKTGTVADLQALYGKKFGIGKKNSGTRGSGEEILANIGVDTSKYTYVHKGYGGTSGAMQNGEIAGMNIPAGPPVSAITSVYEKLGDKITTLDFTDDQ